MKSCIIECDTSFKKATCLRYVDRIRYYHVKHNILCLNIPLFFLIFFFYKIVLPLGVPSCIIKLFIFWPESERSKGSATPGADQRSAVPVIAPTPARSPAVRRGDWCCHCRSSVCLSS